MCLKSSKYFLFLSLQCSCIFCLFNEHLSTIENNNQIIFFEEASTDAFNLAYIQMESELKDFRDITYQDSVLLPFVNQKINNDFSIFDDELTDFGITTIGVLVHRIINLTNPQNSKIIISNVTSSGINFHFSSSFEQNLKPNDRISFNVYFLPTTEEPPLKEEILYFFTSLGNFVHKVRGQVNGNYFRLKPLLNIRLPINSTFSTSIKLHNPLSSNIKLLQIFSSDCNIHLEFPKEENLINFNFTNNSTNSILLPFETRKIAVAKILGNVERNTTSFIFIKYLLQLDRDDDNNINYFSIPSFQLKSKINLITIPVKTKVTLRRDIFSTVNLLDFGFIKAGKHFSSPLKLSVFSTLERSVEIDSIYSESDKVYIQYETHPPILIKSSPRGQPGLPVDIARINIDTSIDDRTTTNIKNKTTLKTKVGRSISRYGNIMAVSRGGNYNVTVPFSALIYEGGIEYNLNELSFLKNLNSVLQREIILTNTLPFSIAIFEAEIEENGKDVSLIEFPIIIFPGQSLPSLIILFNNTASFSSNFSSQINLKTNLTNFQLPLYIFDGELNITLNSIEQNIFNFGIVTAGETRSIFFTMSNLNPISIEILKFHLPTQFSNFISIQIIKQNFENDETQQHFKNKNLSNFLISSNSSSLFKMSLHFNCLKCNFKQSDDAFSDFFSIETIFAFYNFSLNFEVSNSTCLFSIPKKIIFNEAFVGGVYTKSLILMSTLPLQPLRVSILNNKDARFSLSIANKINNNITKLEPEIANNLANISFIPEASCPQKDCYLGIPINSTDDQWFSYGMKLPQNLAEVDYYLFSKLRRKWLELEGKIIKTTVKVDTNKIREFEIPIEANLIWPKLFSHSTVHFPLTAVGNFSIVNLTISNPTTSPIIIQILPLVIYPDSDSLLDFLSEELSLSPLINPIELNETLMFSLRDTELFTLRSGSPTPKLREEVERIIEGPIPRFTLSMLLRPGMSARVRIGFLPSDYTLRSSMMIIRNNLTVIEPVVLYGRGARINIGIDNKTAGSQPLLFELNSTHLNDCSNPLRQLHRMPTTLTVWRLFAVHNNGEVGFSVVNISISGSPCKNRGFRVSNCEQFRLEPNETIYLNISYTPDFLFSINEASLQIFMHMNYTPWSFNLAAVVPKHSLSICHSALPRPPFEALMYQTCVLALIFCLICMISCAYLEGDRVVLCAFKQQFLQKQQKGVFNINESKTATTQVIDDFGVEVEHFYRREFNKISSDAGIFQRVFWHTLNFVLWIFSYVWPFLRREKFNNSTTTMKESTQKQPVFESDEELVDDIENIKNEQQKLQQQTLTNKEVTIINRISKNSTTLNDQKRQQKRTTQLKEKRILINNIEQQQNNEKQQINNNKNVKKTFNIKTSNKENINGFSDEAKVLRRQKYLSVSSSSSGEAIIAENDSDLFNENITNTKTRNNVFKIRRNTSTSEEEIIGKQQHSPKHLNNEYKNRNKTHVLNSDDAEEDSAESEIPEWADEEDVGKCDINEDFEQLAVKSAKLFDTSKSDDNIDDNDQVEKIIEKHVNEYRERLVRIYNGRSHFDISEMLILPSDLTSNISGSNEDACEFLLNSSVIINKSENSPRRRSPGGDVRIKKEQIIDQEEGNNKLIKTTDKNSRGFLFNFEDPIWKPLSELDGLNKE